MVKILSPLTANKCYLLPIRRHSRAEIRSFAFSELFDFKVRGLLAVYRVPEDAYKKDYWPAGEYGLIFTSDDDGYPHFITLLVESGQIVRIEFIVGWPPIEFIWSKSDDFILPPIH